MKAQEMVELRIQKTFEAARFLPGLKKSHPCHRLHGHSFTLIWILHGKINKKTGIAFDYHDLQKILDLELKEFDHHFLNHIIKNPSSENMAIHLYNGLHRRLKQTVQVIVKETPQTECRYPIL